jgi:hypothetical protein
MSKEARKIMSMCDFVVQINIELKDTILGSEDQTKGLSKSIKKCTL